MKSFCTLTQTLLVTALLAACAGEADSQQQQLAEMQMEIDQLTNALGRIEFRVAQLEDQQSTNTASAPAVSATPAQPASLEKSDKRYDLAPVE